MKLLEYQISRKKIKLKTNKQTDKEEGPKVHSSSALDEK